MTSQKDASGSGNRTSEVCRVLSLVSETSVDALERWKVQSASTGPSDMGFYGTLGTRNGAAGARFHNTILPPGEGLQAAGPSLL